MNGKFRLNKPSLATVASDGHHEMFIIPADEILVLNNEEFIGERLMDVLWNGRVVRMFTVDLKEATVVV